MNSYIVTYKIPTNIRTNLIVTSEETIYGILAAFKSIHCGYEYQDDRISVKNYQTGSSIMLSDKDERVINVNLNQLPDTYKPQSMANRVILFEENDTYDIYQFNTVDFLNGIYLAAAWLDIQTDILISEIHLNNQLVYSSNDKAYPMIPSSAIPLRTCNINGPCQLNNSLESRRTAEECQTKSEINDKSLPSLQPNLNQSNIQTRPNFQPNLQPTLQPNIQNSSQNSIQRNSQSIIQPNIQVPIQRGSQNNIQNKAQPDMSNLSVLSSPRIPLGTTQIINSPAMPKAVLPKSPSINDKNEQLVNQNYDKESLSKLTIPDLKALAKEKDISLKGSKKKEDIINKIIDGMK